MSSGRHVEVQVLGDGDPRRRARRPRLLGAAPLPEAVRGGARPRCSSDALRAAMAEAALTLAAHLGYRGLGTVELLVDRERDTFYFLEMNARIQVEHPVTEMVTGLDLVAEQLAVAEGLPLRIRQEDVVLTGHAVECRINAEDWAHGFRPSPGRIDRVVLPAGDGLRVDTHVQGGSVVPPYYDSLLAKLIVHGTDRADALARRAGGAGPAADRGRDDDGAGAPGAAGRRRVRRRGSGHRVLRAVPATHQQTWWGCADGRRRTRRRLAARRQPEPVGRHRPADRRTCSRSRRCWSGSASARWTTPRAPPWASLCAPTGRTRGSGSGCTRAAMPTTKLQFIGTGFRFISWENSHPETMQLVYDRLGGQRHRPGRRPGPDARHGRRPRDRPPAEAGRRSTRSSAR